VHFLLDFFSFLLILPALTVLDFLLRLIIVLLLKVTWSLFPSWHFSFSRKKLPEKKMFLAFTFFSGIYLVTTRGQFILPHFGDLLIIVAASFFHLLYHYKKLTKMLEPEIISWGVTSCAAIFALMLIFILKVNVFSSIGILFVFLSGLAEALIILFMNKTIQITSMTYYVMMTMFVPVINLILGIYF